MVFMTQDTSHQIGGPGGNQPHLAAPALMWIKRAARPA